MESAAGSSLWEDEPTAGGPGRRPDVRVLVLEDDRYVRRLWVHDLREAGYAVIGYAGVTRP